jgi:hypothetical protein
MASVIPFGKSSSSVLLLLLRRNQEVWGLVCCQVAAQKKLPNSLKVQPSNSS